MQSHQYRWLQPHRYHKNCEETRGLILLFIYIHAGPPYLRIRRNTSQEKRKDHCKTEQSHHCPANPVFIFPWPCSIAVSDNQNNHR